MPGAQPAGLVGVVRDCLSDGIPRRSFYVAVVVGTVLNLINQGDAMLGPTSINWFKLALTFAVPYCVATFGAVTALRRTADPEHITPG